ncbi:hypothetical protein HDU76_011650 [Blyttiomyces sp. JEL0837]|nr:hypothetical protein HDU76_011650 [Blyttiomyces sp. JEL0837]
MWQHQNVTAKPPLASPSPHRFLKLPITSQEPTLPISFMVQSTNRSQSVLKPALQHYNTTPSANFLNMNNNFEPSSIRSEEGMENISDKTFGEAMDAWLSLEEAAGNADPIQQQPTIPKSESHQQQQQQQLFESLALSGARGSSTSALSSSDDFDVIMADVKVSSEPTESQSTAVSQKRKRGEEEDDNDGGSSKTIEKQEKKMKRG